MRRAGPSPDVLRDSRAVVQEDRDAGCRRGGAAFGVTMRLIDTHSHIHDASSMDDRDAVIERARDAGVELIVDARSRRAEQPGRASSWRSAHADIVVAAAGVHPHDAKEATGADLDELEALAEGQPESR